MPLSVYAYAVRSRSGRRAPSAGSAYYPFCDYSPELVALQDGGRSRDSSPLHRPRPRRAVPRGEEVEDGREGGRAGARGRPSLLAEHHFEHSARLQALAEQLGCRDQEDLWEQLFEADLGRVGAAEHVAARHGVLPARAPGPHRRPSSPRGHHGPGGRDGVARPARRCPGAGPGDGPGAGRRRRLPRRGAAGAAGRSPPARPQVSLAGVTADSALIRYTFERLERLNGYASGMTSPGLAPAPVAAGERPRPRPTRRAPRPASTALMDITAELRAPAPHAGGAAVGDRGVRAGAAPRRPQGTGRAPAQRPGRRHHAAASSRATPTSRERSCGPPRGRCSPAPPSGPSRPVRARRRWCPTRSSACDASGSGSTASSGGPPRSTSTAARPTGPPADCCTASPCSACRSPSASPAPTS